MLTTNSALDVNPSASLASLSRNASVISTSSSDSGPAVSPIKIPRPRPIRTFSSPRSGSPASPVSKAPRPPSYLTKELGLLNGTTEPAPSPVNNPKARSKSRGRNISINDFAVGETIGEGSYSTVSQILHLRLRSMTETR